MTETRGGGGEGKGRRDDRDTRGGGGGTWGEGGGDDRDTGAGWGVGRRQRHAPVLTSLWKPLPAPRPRLAHFPRCCRPPLFPAQLPPYGLGSNPCEARPPKRGEGCGEGEGCPPLMRERALERAGSAPPGSTLSGTGVLRHDGGTGVLRHDGGTGVSGWMHSVGTLPSCSCAFFLPPPPPVRPLLLLWLLCWCWIVLLLLAPAASPRIVLCPFILLQDTQA